MKHKFLITGLATATILSAAALTQLSPSVYAAETTTAANNSNSNSEITEKPAATPAKKTEVEKAKEAADAKVEEAQAKVDTTTTKAKEADTKLEAEKKEAAEADAAKTKAEEAKKTADDELAAAKTKAAEADAKAKEEAKKEEDAKKEEADSKDALSKALDQLEEAIANDSTITDKEAAKELVDKEGLLKAIESGEITAKDLLAEFTDDNEKSEKNEALEKKLRDKEEAKTTDAGASPVTEGKTSALPENLKAKIDEAEKADAARPASEKLQDKADDLGEEVDELTEAANAAKAEEDKKADTLTKRDETLQKTQKALETAKANGSSDEIVKILEDVAKKAEAARDAAQSEFDDAAAETKAAAEELNELTDKYNKTLEEVKAAKEKEANEPAKPAEETPAKPAEKTEAEKAAEAKKEADAKVAELEKKVAEEAKKVEEATTKATKEAEDVKAAQTAKEEADKAKTDAEAELAKAKEEAEKAKAKVEEEADNKEALKAALEQLEKVAEDQINKDDRIKSEDKAKAIEEAKAAIGKDALLKAIEDGVITATEAAKELEDQNTTAEATKDQDPQADEIGATKQEGKPLSELPAADKEKLDAAYNKEASKPIVKKLQDIADDIAEKIEKLTKVADKDKADATEKAKAVEEKNAALDKQKETLDKAKAALETAKKNKADQAIQDGLQDAVTKLEASVASAKTAADEAQAKFDEVNEVVKAYKSAIDELTDDYNATLGYIENLKEVPKGEEPKDFSGGVNDEEAPTGDAKQPDEVPTVPNAPEFNGGVNPADAPTAEEKPEFNGGVNDEEAPTVPNNPEGEAPVEPKVESSKGEALVQPALPEFGANNPEIKKILNEIAKVKEQLKDAEENEGVEDYYKEGLSERLKDLEEAFDTLSQNLPAVNEVPEFKGGANFVEAAVNEVPEYDLSKLNKYPTPNQEPTPGTPAPKEEQKAPSNNNPAGINPRTSANSAQAATEEKPAEKPAVALAVAEAPKAQESKQAELPNTGAAELGVFTPAVLSILAGLGLVAPKGKKEDQ